jgi:hypothetical protein
MAVLSKTTNRSTSIEQYDLLSLVNIPLTGVVASTPVDGVPLEDGMKVTLLGQTVTGDYGLYDCAVSGANYTLTLSSGRSYTPNTTFNNGAPFIFHVSQGNSNLGTWQFSQNGTVVSLNKFLVSDNDKYEQITTAGLNIPSNGTLAVVLTYVNTYSVIDTVNCYALSPSGAVLNLSLNNVTADSLTGQTRQITNMSATPATNFTLITKVTGV